VVTAGQKPEDNCLHFFLDPSHKMPLQNFTTKSRLTGICNGGVLIQKIKILSFDITDTAYRQTGDMYTQGLWIA